MEFIAFDTQPNLFLIIGIENGEHMMIAFKNREMDFYLNNEENTINCIKLRSSNASILTHKVNQLVKQR